ncbi:hypothetical protein OROMI_032754 [Orobanche minor]
MLIFVLSLVLSVSRVFRGASAANMYPKVKVRIEREEDDQFAYENTSLESLKAFEWLSLHHSSSLDESPAPVARVLPGSYSPKSPNPSFLTSKVANKKKAVTEENRKNVRPASAPRPRAVLSSPVIGDVLMDQHLSDRPTVQDLYFKPPYVSTFSNIRYECASSGYIPHVNSDYNDGIIGSKTRTRGKLVSGLKNRHSNRHSECRIFPKFTTSEPKNDVRAKGRTTLAESRIRAEHRKNDKISM